MNNKKQHTKYISILKHVFNRLEQLEKTIEILKDILEIQIGIKVNGQKILIVSIVEIGEWFTIDISEEQYSLLKEVLRNE